MSLIELRSGPAKHKHIQGDYLFLTVQITEENVVVSLGPDCPPEHRIVSPLWSHTVFELENLAMGFEFVAKGKLPKYYEVPSRDTLIGPSVGLRPGLQFQLGHPGIGEFEDWGTYIYCHLAERVLALFEKEERLLVKVPIVHLEAMNVNRIERVTFHPDDLLRFAEELYAEVKRIEPLFFRDEEPEHG